MTLSPSELSALGYAGLGLIVVVLTSLLKTVNLSAKQSHLIATVTSLLTGVVSNYFSQHGTADLVSVAQHSTVIYAASQLLYNFVIQDTTFNDWLTKFNLLPAKD
jgi:hypothetical protein